MTVVFMFPGQSSRYAGMLEAPLAVSTAAGEALNVASELLGRDLRADFAADAAAPFVRNEDVQLAVFVVNHLWMVALEAAGVRADVSLGLSLGEYNHLIHIGALPFAEALDLVRARGKAYDSGPPGIMIAAQPVSVVEAEAAIAQASARGVVELVSFNSPSQQILGGDEEAVREAARWLEDEHYAQPVVIEESLPMHSSLFRPVAELFAPALKRAPFTAPKLPYLSNRSATMTAHPSRETFVQRLTEHLYRPVRWRESVEHVHAVLPRAVFVEVGARSVLGNLLRRRWLRVPQISVDRSGASSASFAADIEALRGGHDGL